MILSLNVIYTLAFHFPAVILTVSLIVSKVKFSNTVTVKFLTSISLIFENSQVINQITEIENNDSDRLVLPL